jgi:hypothetical protein
MVFADAKLVEPRAQIRLDVVGQDPALIQHQFDEVRVHCTLDLVVEIGSQRVPVDPVAHRRCVEHVEPVTVVTQISLKELQRESRVGKQDQGRKHRESSKPSEKGDISHVFLLGAAETRSALHSSPNGNHASRPIRRGRNVTARTQLGERGSAGRRG